MVISLVKVQPSASHNVVKEVVNDSYQDMSVNSDSSKDSKEDSARDKKIVDDGEQTKKESVGEGSGSSDSEIVDGGEQTKKESVGEGSGSSDSEIVDGGEQTKKESVGEGSGSSDSEIVDGGSGQGDGDDGSGSSDSEIVDDGSGQGDGDDGSGSGSGSSDSEIVDDGGQGDGDDGSGSSDSEIVDDGGQGDGGSRDKSVNTMKDNNYDVTSSSMNNIYAKKSTVYALVVGLVIAVGIAGFMAGAYMMNMDQKEQITQENIDDAIAKLELKMLQQQLANRQQQQQPPVVRISADDDPVIGDLNAPITIIEFSDFQCPFCARFNAQTLPLIEEEYIDKGLVKLVFRDFPIQNIHPNAVITALAAECADDQDDFKGMHDILFEKQREWSSVGAESILAVLVGYATEIGINADEFETCVAMGTHVDDIRGDLEDGRAYGVSGTPGFYIGNDNIGYVEIQGAQPFESFKRVIDTQLGL